MVVDDDVLMRDLVAEWLTAAGYPTCQAADGETAVRMMHGRRAVLVVTDMHMPRGDGSQVLLALRREYIGLPVIAMSGHFRGGEITAERALDLGARRVLAKPFTRRALLRAVQDLIGPPAAR
jgi:CheY-like chemotaxis protein